MKQIKIGQMIKRLTKYKNNLAKIRDDMDDYLSEVADISEANSDVILDLESAIETLSKYV